LAGRHPSIRLLVISEHKSKTQAQYYRSITAIAPTLAWAALVAANRRCSGDSTEATSLEARGRRRAATRRTDMTTVVIGRIGREVREGEEEGRNQVELKSSRVIHKKRRCRRRSALVRPDRRHSRRKRPSRLFLICRANPSSSLILSSLWSHSIPQTSQIPQ
jgi:hypothetical protein